jgi:hypothetical protein
MYCPKCGSENQTEVKFCTRCGANLSVVSEAISGKSADKPWSDDPIVDMLKQYYDGRQSTAVGLGSMLIGLTVLVMLLKLNVPENLTGVLLNAVAACALIYGAMGIIYGIAGWIESSSKLKALGYDKPKNAASKPKKAAAELPSASTLMNVKGYDTDSISAPLSSTDAMNSPASVTEHTTRELQESRSEGDIGSPREV